MLSWTMRPDVDVPLAPFLSERDVDRWRRREFESRDEARTSLARSDGLLLLEPVAEAAAEEPGKPAYPRLRSTQSWFEITSTRSLVLEQPIERQARVQNRDGDRRVRRKTVLNRTWQHECAPMMRAARGLPAAPCAKPPARSRRRSWSRRRARPRPPSSASGA